MNDEPQSLTREQQARLDEFRAWRKQQLDLVQAMPALEHKLQDQVYHPADSKVVAYLIAKCDPVFLAELAFDALQNGRFTSGMVTFDKELRRWRGMPAGEREARRKAREEQQEAARLVREQRKAAGKSGRGRTPTHTAETFCAWWSLYCTDHSATSGTACFPCVEELWDYVRSGAGLAVKISRKTFFKFRKEVAERGYLADRFDNVNRRKVYLVAGPRLAESGVEAPAEAEVEEVVSL